MTWSYARTWLSKLCHLFTSTMVSPTPPPPPTGRTRRTVASQMIEKIVGNPNVDKQTEAKLKSIVEGEMRAELKHIVSIPSHQIPHPGHILMRIMYRTRNTPTKAILSLQRLPKRRFRSRSIGGPSSPYASSVTCTLITLHSFRRPACKSILNISRTS